jgi:hypothetical protein
MEFSNASALDLSRRPQGGAGAGGVRWIEENEGFEQRVRRGAN